ncbi:transcriptional regulator [Spongiibacter sp. IMCC21906]|uniref:LysR substrate-binding domain-containing protein n=1 Tax=Spongiibacter sp. IMCC21906 TaxID=1620392 RepID=UPI00062E01D6|nr:LysR family transcriptional regulator [Spongiibacter sp. IMCC21906]AKH69323.1 transcriptional regulator [Spongiibacter sp. IMCC21906]
MNVVKLKNVIAVDQFGSFSAAAKIVHLTQSALTKHVADIEQDVGFALFERHAKGVHATAEGRAFIDRATRIVADLEQLSSDTKAGHILGVPRLRVGISPPSLVSLLNAPLTKVLERHPAIRLEETAGWAEQTVQQLKNGDIDVLIGPAGPIQQHKQFKVYDLEPFTMCFFVRKGHPLSKVTKLRVEHLHQYPIALADRSAATLDLINQLFGVPEIPQEKQVHIIGHFPLTCKIVATSDTVGNVGAAFRRDELFCQKFSILEFDSLKPIPLAIAYDGKRQPAPPILELVNLLRSEPHWARGE